MDELYVEREAIALFEAMLQVDPAARADWIDAHSEGNPALRARLTAMRAADMRAQLRTGAATETLDEEPPPERIGAYRITGLIGRGGMGSVYRGERMTGDFAHVAAIKVIKPGLLSEQLVARFRSERQTLAQLSHPGIAQLYDGGETESGAPYIVMENVDGMPLLEWASAHAPTLAERLRLFREICAAVAFAHRNLVVHRDLTPSNVLVTRDGSAKLIDFGIAKPADTGAGGADTPSLASLSLTPGYAAPERMASAQVTTAADIYSLGRLLRKLIPEDQSRELAAIVARATAPAPLDRYPTADALVGDVQAWANGFPVEAIGRGRRYAAAKFIGRHRLGVALATTALVLLVAALGATLLANARAETARGEAERRFEQTRAIAKTLLFETFDEVSRTPGSTRARAMLARTGLNYLDALAADPRAPADVKLETARGYVRLAQVTGGGQSSHYGLTRDSDALLAHAATIYTALEPGHAGEPEFRKAKAALLLEQAGSNLYTNNAIALARQQALAAQGLLRGIASADADAAATYALAVQAEGDSFGWDDDYAAALPIFQRAESFIAGLPAGLADGRRVLSVRSSNLRLLAEASHKLKREEAAVAAIERAVAINRLLNKRIPDDPVLVRKLVSSLWYRAVVLRTLGRDAAARASIEEAVTLARGAMNRDSTDAGATQLFSVVAEVHAQVLADLGQYAESNKVGEELTAVHRRNIRLSGGAAGTIRSMTTALATRGANYYNGGYYAEACTVWREGLANFAMLERSGKMTETDRRNGYPEMRSRVAKACDNGPRAGLGPRL